jgi:hypothetical protein
MGLFKASAAVKDQPHPFQAGPEVPAVYPKSGAMYPEASVEEDGSVVSSKSPKCMLCGALESDHLHTEGKAEADVEPLHWG